MRTQCGTRPVLPTSHPPRSPYRVAGSVLLFFYTIVLLSSMSRVHIRRNSGGSMVFLLEDHTEGLRALGQDSSHTRSVLHLPLSSHSLNYRLGQEASQSSHVMRASLGWHPTTPRRRWAFRNWRASLFSSEVVAEHLPAQSCTQSLCEHAAACTGNAATAKFDCVQDTTGPQLLWFACLAFRIQGSKLLVLVLLFPSGIVKVAARTSSPRQVGVSAYILAGIVAT